MWWIVTKKCSETYWRKRVDYVKFSFCVSADKTELNRELKCRGSTNESKERKVFSELYNENSSRKEWILCRIILICLWILLCAWRNFLLCLTKHFPVAYLSHTFAHTHTQFVSVGKVCDTNAHGLESHEKGKSFSNILEAKISSKAKHGTFFRNLYPRQHPPNHHPAFSSCP